MGWLPDYVLVKISAAIHLYSMMLSADQIYATPDETTNRPISNAWNPFPCIASQMFARPLIVVECMHRPSGLNLPHPNNWKYAANIHHSAASKNWMVRILLFHANCWIVGYSFIDPKTKSSKRRLRWCDSSIDAACLIIIHLRSLRLTLFYGREKKRKLRKESNGVVRLFLC